MAYGVPTIRRIGLAHTRVGPRSLSTLQPAQKKDVQTEAQISRFYTIFSIKDVLPPFIRLAFPVLINPILSISRVRGKPYGFAAHTPL